MTQPDNFIPQDAISVSENPNPAVTALSVIAEKTQQDWEDELAGPYTTKINPLLTWVTNLDLTEILQRLGALDGVEALIAAFQDALEPLLDPLTAALLNCNGSNNSTVIDDQSPLNANWTCAGNAKLSTAVKKFGDSSLLLDGSGDYIYPTAPASSFAWGQSDFTIEMWAYTTSVATLQTLYDSGGGLSPRLQFSNSKLIYSVNGQVAIQGTTTLSGSTWYHVAVSREGDTTRLFLNGQQEGPDWTDETNYVNTANRPRIGLNVDGIHGFVGNIDSIRLTRLCRYTENFTPPAAQFTQSLLSYLGEIVENLGRVTFTAGANILDFLVTDIGVALVETIMSGLQVVAAVGNGVFNVIAEILQWFFDQPGVEGAVAVFNDVLTFFADIIEQVGGLSLWNDGLAAVTALLQLVGNIVGQTFESVNNALEYFADEGTFIGQLAANITGIALNLISDPFDAIANWADTLPPLFDTVTVAILNGNGANNTTVIDDQSPLNADWKAEGNTKISTAVKKYGTGSMLFDGTGDYIEPTTALSSFAWGNRDFTIEMWIYRTSLNANEMLWDAGASALKIDANKLVWVVDGQTRIQGATNLNINTWYHVAVCRSGTQTRLWLNGNLQGSAWTDATDYSAQSVRIGLSTTGTLGFTGNIDSVRLTKGLGRYPNRFTPPSAEFLPAILNNIPIIGPILEGITGIVGAGLQDLIDFFDGITGGAGSFLAQLVSAITGDAINLITSPLEALGTFFAGLPEIFEFFSGVIESVFDALDVTIERVIDVFKAVVEIIVGLFAGFPDFAAMLTYLRNSLLRILAAIGIISGEDGAEFSLQMIFDGIVDFFENIPLIGPIITALTGGATLDGKPVTDLGMLAQWFFQNVLRVDSMLPADNLRGLLPWFLLPKIPVGHIDGSTPNLLEQTGFTRAAVMQQGGRWSWDANIGSGAAKVTAASAAAFLYSNAVAVSEGQQFTISAQVQYSNLTWNPLASPVMLGLRLYNNGQIVQSNQPVVYAPSIGLGTQNFFLLTGNYTIPAGVDTVRMSLGVTQSATSGTVWFDDVVMRKTGLLDQGLVGELINAWNGLVDGLNGSQQGTSNLAEGTGPGLFNPSSGVRQAASTAFTTATAAQTAASSAASAATAAQSAASTAQSTADTANTILETKSSAGTNLMLSPTFASTSITRIPYPLNATGTQGYSTEQSRSGVRSWKWLQPSGQARGLYLAPTQTGRTYAVKAGEKYFLEAFLYPDAPGAVTGTVTLGATYTVSKTGATSTSDQTVNIPTKGQWNQLNREVTIPAGVDLAEFYVYTTSSTASLALYVDDVTVREVTDAKAAQAAAETAATAASTAQNTANTAQNAANAAQNTATTASNTANTAQNTANSANTAAANAQSTANSANTAATNAATAASNAATAASNAQNSANTANTGVQNTLNGVYVGLSGVALNGSSASSANAQAAANATREALASLQAKISALQTNNSTFSGKAFFQDFSNYAASNNGFGGNWLSPLYTAVGNSSGTVGIETTSGAARAAWIGSGLDRRRAIVLYGSTLGTGDDSVQAVREANDYQRVGAVLSSSLTSGPNYIFARANSTATIGIYAKLVVNNLFDNGTAEIYALTNTGWPGSRIGGPTSFTHIPGSTYWLECGVGAGVRRHRLFRDNYQIIDTSTDAVSILPSSLGASAASYRYHGVGLEANANSLFRFEPADVAGYAAYDNKPLPTLGSGMRITRTSTALQTLIAGDRIVTAWNAAPDRITSDLTYNSTTGEVTVSVAGWYFVEVGLQFNAVIANNNNVAAACFRNGTIHSVGHHQWGTTVASFGTRAAGSWVVYCEAGNRLAGGYSSSSTFTNSLTGDATNSRTYFSVTFMSNLKPTNPT